jgi:hypothetical protein
MTLRRTYILISALLVLAGISLAHSTTDGSLNTAEYRAELDRLLATTQQLDSSGAQALQSLHRLPQSWRIRADQREFEISAEGLQRDIRRYEREKNATNAMAIRTRLTSLRREIDGYDKPPADVSASRNQLNAILARPEFRDVRGSNWLDRLKQWLVEFLLRILRKVFRSVSIPTISRFFIYALMAVALLALGFVAYRTIWRGREVPEVVPKDLAISAKQWTIWLSEARAAAALGEWRDAIHLAYWAGISFLEGQGFWKPDRARTPREYLRLLSGSSEHRETLAALTSIFEIAWYAKRDATEGTFSQTLEQLEKLGCQ